MAYEFKNFEGLLTKAGVTVAEAAKLFRTTRPTIYHWMKGNVPTQGIVREYAERVAGVLERAVKAQDLPLAEGLSKEERQAALISAVRKNSGK